MSRSKRPEIDTLILGCTHFPMLSEVISDYMGGRHPVNAGRNGKTAKAALEADGLLNEKEVSLKTEFFVSDRPEGFPALPRSFSAKKFPAMSPQ